MADTNKRKKSAYYGKGGFKRSKSQFTLRPGLKGFLATCNFREKDCIKEATNILSECADKIYGEDKSSCSEPEPNPTNTKIVFKDSDEEESEDDIETALAREVNVLKQERQTAPSKRRFQVIDSGADNCIFIQTTVEDPVTVVETILKDIESQSKQKTRFLLRLLPIEVTCKAWPEDIKNASQKLLDKYFKGEPTTFCVVFKRRNNNNVLREELINDLASDIKLCNPLHKADMKQPELSVIVEVIRNVCCMAVVPKYFHYRKYNLLELAKPKAPDSNKGEEASQVGSSQVNLEGDLTLNCKPESDDKGDKENLCQEGQTEGAGSLHDTTSEGNGVELVPPQPKENPVLSDDGTLTVTT